MGIFDNQKYYAKMAVAWLVSVCFVKFPRETENFLMTTKIDKETLDEASQVIIEKLTALKTDYENKKMAKKIK